MDYTIRKMKKGLNFKGLLLGTLLLLAAVYAILEFLVLEKFIILPQWLRDRLLVDQISPISTARKIRNYRWLPALISGVIPMSILIIVLSLKGYKRTEIENKVGFPNFFSKNKTSAYPLLIGIIIFFVILTIILFLSNRP